MEIEQIGRYQVLSELGQGAMGVVYKAIDPLIDRVVAIKTINLNLSKDEMADFEERFNREARSAGRLNHPNIVTIYDVGRSEHIAFMAMEYLEGRELKDIISSERLTPGKAAEIIAQVAEGLAFAHDNGVIHRDIKPANIMVLGNGSVKITDFGIAKMSSGSRTQIGIVLGSPKYMSPEQVIGKAVDGRSDIFSLGTVLYELLTGKSAFGGEDSTLATIMYRILNDSPALPSSVDPSIPGAFDYIVSRAIAKEPENRYASAREMASDLRNYLNLEYTLPAQTARGEKSLKNDSRIVDGDTTMVIDIGTPTEHGVSRRAKLIGAGAAAAAVLFAAVVAALYDGSPRTPETAQKGQTAQPAIVVETPPIPSQLKPREAAPQATASAPESTNKDKEPASRPASASRADSASKPASASKPVSASAAAPAAVANSRITFTILPWGEVFIDGKSRGPSPPLKEISLPAGRHKIEIRNADFPAYRETVELKSDGHHKIQHKFK